MSDLPDKPDVVTKQREKTLAAYRAKPSQIRTDSNGEQKERREYAKRPVLELLQNAEDALSDDDREGRVLLKLCGNTLIVANEGARFTDRGFESLCTLDNSAKQSAVPRTTYRRTIGSKGTGFKAVLNWTDRIELRSGPIKALFDRAQAASEIRAALDSDGIRELDQDREWSDELMPLLHVPLPLHLDSELGLLSRDRWDTVFRLRVVPEKRAAVAQTLQAIDPRQWLFLERIAEIQVEIETTPTLWQLVRRDTRRFGDGGTCYQLHVSKDGRPLAQYHVLRQALPKTVKPANEYEIGVAEVGFAYQVDGEESDHPARIANFFATDCLSPFPAIAVHGTFLLKADRSRLAEDDPNYQGQLIDALCELACSRLIPELVAKYGAGSLAYLEPVRRDRNDADGAGIEVAVREQLIEAVSDTRFVPTIAGSPAPPHGLQLWKHGLGELLAEGPTSDRHDRLPAVAWCDESTRTIFRGLGAEDLVPVDHVRLLKDWQPSTRETAFAAHRLLGAAFGEISWRLYTGNELRYEKERFERVAAGLLIWLTSRGDYRALNEQVPFFEPRKRHDPVPSVLKLDWLDSSFLEMLKDRELWDQPFFTELRKDKLHGSSRDDILRYGLLPQLKTEQDWWEQHGYEVLQTLMRFGFSADEARDVLSDPLREKVSEQVRLPTRDCGWQPAGSVYAGADWDNAWAENFVAASGGTRFLLSSPPSFTERVDWKPLLLYCGVSWAPKWRRHVRDDKYDWGWPSDYRQGLATSPSTFVGISGWEEFWRNVGAFALGEHLAKKPDNRIKRYPLFETWAIEGLEEFVSGFDGNTARLAALKGLWESQPSRRKLEVGLRGKLGRSFGRYQFADQDCFLAWQISRCTVFDVPRSPLFPDGRATLSDLFVGSTINEAWMKWLPRLSLSGASDKDRHALAAFALGFGAKERPGDYSASQWHQWLQSLAHWEFDAPPVKESRDLMHTLAHLDADLSEWGKDIRLPCQISGEQVRFDLLDELVLVDEPHFQALEVALLNRNLGLLLASVSDSKRLMTKFGCESRAVSALVNVAIAESRPSSDATARLTRIEQQRAPILAWFEHAAKESAAERLRLHWPREIVPHDPLQVTVRLQQGDELGTLPQPFLVTGDGALHVQAGEGDLLWEYLAGGLKQSAKTDAPIEDGLVRLLQAIEKSEQAVADFFKAKGLDPQDIERWDLQITSLAEQNTSKEEPTPAAHESKRPEPQSPSTSGPAQSDGNEGRAEKQPGHRSAAPAADRPSVNNIELQNSPTRHHHPSEPQSPASRESSSDRRAVESHQSTQQHRAHAQHRGQDPRESGQDAEEWFFHELKDHLGNTWKLLRHDRAGPGETDVVVIKDGEERLHIEVKGMETGTLFWSGDEVKKAQWCAEKSVPYAMVVLTPLPNDEGPTDASDYAGKWEVHWIPRPLDHFKNHWREGRVGGEWRWNSDTVSTATIQAQEPWHPPVPPAKEARSISYKISPSTTDFVLDGIAAVDELLDSASEHESHEE